MTESTDPTTGSTTGTVPPDVPAELEQRSMYELIGGAPTVRAIVDRFYDLMDTDETFQPIRRMHADDLSPMRASLTAWVSAWLGGPAMERHVCMHSAHAPFTIDERAADLWVACMTSAIDDVGMTDRYRALVVPAFERVAAMLRSTGTPHDAPATGQRHSRG